MTKILTDLYSLCHFNQAYITKPEHYLIEYYAPYFSLIENLILCDKIVAEENGLSHFNLKPMCDCFTDAFEYISDPRLYKISEAGSIEMVDIDVCKRSMLYAEIAQSNDMYFSPHPYRDKAFSNKLDQYISSLASDVINHVDQRLCESKCGQIAKIDFEIPPIIEHCFHFAKSNKISLVASINEIRNTKNAQRFRTYITNLDSELREVSPRKKIVILQSIFRDIDNLCNSWINDLTENVDFRRRKIKLSKIPLVGRIFDVTGTGDIAMKDPLISHPKPHLLFINDLYRNNTVQPLVKDSKPPLTSPT